MTRLLPEKIRNAPKKYSVTLGESIRDGRKSVESHEFSTLSTGFSTGCGTTFGEKKVDIKRKMRKDEKRIFPGKTVGTK